MASEAQPGLQPRRVGKPGQQKRPPTEPDGGRYQRWTRTQSIRTASAIPVEAAIVDRADLPVYLRIAEKAKHVRDLGMSDSAIARALGVSDKTVTKALRGS